MFYCFHVNLVGAKGAVLEAERVIEGRPPERRFFPNFLEPRDRHDEEELAEFFKRMRSEELEPA